MKTFKIIMIVLVLAFLLLFLSYENGYYRSLNKEKMLLTDEKIKEYEEDLKNGVDVSSKSYVVTPQEYDSPYTREILNISSIIEKGLSNMIKYIFQKVGNIVDE